MGDLDAYVSSYFIFRCSCRVWKVASPFLNDLGALFLGFETREELLKGFEKVLVGVESCEALFWDLFTWEGFFVWLWNP